MKKLELVKEESSQEIADTELVKKLELRKQQAVQDCSQKIAALLEQYGCVLVTVQEYVNNVPQQMQVKVLPKQ